MAQFDTKEIVIGGIEWKTAPFRFSRMFTLAGGNGGSYVDVLLSGVSPLALTNALGLNYIKALGATEQRNLPSEYTQLEYIALDGRCYFDTGFLANTTTTTYHTGITPISVTGVGRGIFGSRNDTIASNNSCNVFILATGVFRMDWTAGNMTIQINSPAGVYYDIVCSRPETTINGTTYSRDNTTSVDQQYSFLIGNFSNAGTEPYVQGFVGYIHFSELYSNGVLVHKYLPARRNSDGVLGLYDVVAGDFLTNQGSGKLAAGADATPTPDTPMDIICNNGVLKVNSQGQIYTDGTQETVNITNGGTATAENLFKVGYYQDVQSIIDGVVTRNVGIKVFDGTEDWTYNNSAFLMNLSDRLSQKKFMFCTHFNYNDESSTTIPNLCIGCDSTTNTIFIKYQTYNTVEQFKQYLADQYANGTPVIVIYPLATATTETVSGQSLTASGNCTVTATGSLDNLELELSYKQSI